MRHLTGLALCVGLLTTACGGASAPSAPPAPPSMSGTWMGQDATSRITFTIAAAGSTISGNGVFQQATISEALVVTGTYVYPNIALTMAAQGFQPLNFSGQRNGSLLIGTLNGSGYLSTSFTFALQP